MSNSHWEARGTSDEARGGLTRREALRRGTLAGLGLVWVKPSVDSFAMTAQYAQATSPVPETTAPGNETTEPSTENTTVESTSPSTETTQASDTTEDTVESKTVHTTGASSTSQPSNGGTRAEASGEIKDEVLSGDLPFTGLPLEQLLPLAGGAVATGAAAVRLARERSEKEIEDTE